MLDCLRILLDARLSRMDERGASAVEYGLPLAGLGAVIAAVVLVFGTQLSTIFTTTCDSVAGGDGSC